MKKICVRVCYCTIISFAFFLAIIFSGIAEESGNVDKYNKCPLSSAIALKYKAEIGEGRLEIIIKQQNSEDLVEDLRIYADNFKTWSVTYLPHIVKISDNQNSASLTSEEKRKQKIEQFKKEWYQGTEPIQQNGSIIVAEMKELAARNEKKAIIYLKSIAELKLPPGLDNPTSAMIKHQYQNPAAEAWLKLTMPKDISDADVKLWLTKFIAEEKAKGAEKKTWATEAAERMLRKMEKESQPSGSDALTTGR